jgi:hypothetical protein
MDPSAAQLHEEASSQLGSRGSPRNSPKSQMSSSPVMYRSSPAPIPSAADTPMGDEGDDQAMTEDGDRTPRATGNLIGGRLINCLAKHS